MQQRIFRMKSNSVFYVSIDSAGGTLLLKQQMPEWADDVSRPDLSIYETVVHP